MGKRVLVAEFSHETNTFSVQPANIAAFERRVWHFGAEVPGQFRDTNTEMAGFLDAAEAYGWGLVHTVSAAANPCGKVTDEVWHRVTRAILEPLSSGPAFDGILLALHGAMVTESHDDAESVLLESVREVVGPLVPIATTLDLHANLGPSSAANANIICSYRTYPHVDMRIRGKQAGDLLHRAMTRSVLPVCAYARRPMLQGADGGRTDVQPMIDLLDKAAQFEAEPGCWCVSINAGFCHADIADVGPSVTVTADGPGERYQEMAEDLMADIWETRDVVNNTYLSVDKAAEIAAGHDRGAKPLVIADYADNPGAGSYGDATNLLRAMLEAGLSEACFGALRDPAAVSQMRQAGVGARLQLEIGGKVHPGMGGAPLALSGQVTNLTDGQFVYDGPMWAGMAASLGPTAVFHVDGVDILVSSNLQQIVDLQQFRANGIEPTTQRVIGLKSMQHFRAAYEPISSRVVVCDSGALASPDLARLAFTNVRRPIYPLDNF